MKPPDGGAAPGLEAVKPPALNSTTAMVIDNDVFRELIAERSQRLLGLADYLVPRRASLPPLTRPLLGELLSQSTQLEELLDAYGARHNQRWCRYRALVAAFKLFANVGYKLLHVQHFLPNYRLVRIEQNFPAATSQALAFTRDVLVEVSLRILDQATRLDLPLPPAVRQSDYAEQFPPGTLACDRSARRLESTPETVTHLATAFLNLAAESELLHTVARLQPDQYAAHFPEPVSEENLRYLKHRFHNLQSLYDTHVSATEVEQQDRDLPVLRGHISVIYHLLDSATELAHYYERHVNLQTADPALRYRPVVDPNALLAILMGYAITYAGYYLACGRRLCHGMLKRYAQPGRIEVPVPSYRGFHVRPATLIAKIVLHYGSEVRMELEGDSYDASAPMDLFRANEKINARKRRWLASEIARLPLNSTPEDPGQIKAAVLEVVLALAEQGKLVIYEQPLKLAVEPDGTGDSLLEQVSAAIARLQATGQIDIKTDLTIAFSGDRRVLADIALLARHGYGEDNFGNNIPLPRELAYLRR